MANERELAAALLQAESLALICHLNPDGDAIGSTLAMAAALRKLGKRVAVFDVDKVPDTLAGLTGAGDFRHPGSLGADERFDLLLCLDTSDAARAGLVDGKPAFDLLKARCGRTAQIDHHGTNPGYCELNLVEPEAAAAGLPVRRVIAALGVPLDPDIAACLYAAIATDTGNFSHGNTSAEAFRAAAELMEAGLDLTEWNRRLFVERELPRTRLIGFALNTLNIRAGGRLATLCLTRADFEAAGALPEHADNIVNEAMAVAGVRMALFARETAEGTVKMSLRAIAPWRVDRVAQAFGGGGHAQAAGCTLTGDLRGCLGRVAQAMEQALGEVDA